MQCCVPEIMTFVNASSTFAREMNLKEMSNSMLKRAQRYRCMYLKLQKGYTNWKIRYQPYTTDEDHPRKANYLPIIEY